MFSSSFPHKANKIFMTQCNYHFWLIKDIFTLEGTTEGNTDCLQKGIVTRVSDPPALISLNI